LGGEKIYKKKWGTSRAGDPAGHKTSKSVRNGSDFRKGGPVKERQGGESESLV